ncbi:uncharacterized protein LOC123524337 isoform X1 [Mercenaria mercenaria]|uniref:uncharacterized protein LOC123524337 isoform X1 n=1 Tax=Mercenaria mercenaria TaxID=6596 RepID=UPI00234F290E|nr:uncharacterized protein LOC123524337 isoform X1 [Mercenaria mercenaria]XP_045158391.2 uncharacterized protein LOC123524337 isoform X1 [Mercenaria mercenaria]
MKQSDGNIAQQFVSMKTTQKRLAQTEDILNDLDAHVHAKVSFTADQTVLGFLQQLKAFGSIIRNTVYSVKGTRKMNIKVQNDSSGCLVYGSCLTEDGELLIPDCNNKKLKRADIVKLSVVDYCELPHHPRDVCGIDKQEAVVTLGNNSIQFVSLGNKLALTRDMKLNHRCFCIAYRNNKLYISNNNKSVYVHDMTGTLLQTISKDSSGKDLFTYSRHIAFSDCGDKIFVANGEQGVVTVDV